VFATTFYPHLIVVDYGTDERRYIERHWDGLTVAFGCWFALTWHGVLISYIPTIMEKQIPYHIGTEGWKREGLIVSLSNDRPGMPRC
jgi:hypothetical protein